MFLVYICVRAPFKSNALCSFVIQRVGQIVFMVVSQVVCRSDTSDYKRAAFAVRVYLFMISHVRDTDAIKETYDCNRVHRVTESTASRQQVSSCPTVVGHGKDSLGKAIFCSRQLKVAKIHGRAGPKKSTIVMSC